MAFGLLYFFYSASSSSNQLFFRSLLHWLPCTVLPQTQYSILSIYFELGISVGISLCLSSSAVSIFCSFMAIQIHSQQFVFYGFCLFVGWLVGFFCLHVSAENFNGVFSQSSIVCFGRRSCVAVCQGHHKQAEMCPWGNERHLRHFWDDGHHSLSMAIHCRHLLFAVFDYICVALFHVLPESDQLCQVGALTQLKK